LPTELNNEIVQAPIERGVCLQGSFRDCRPQLHPDFGQFIALLLARVLCRSACAQALK